MANAHAVTLVAHDVGGVGGMERQLAELVVGLADRGHLVTVVSRTCQLPRHERVVWIRIAAPRRPFALAYPWFVLAGSLKVARSRRGILHTTGAIILNRADVSTVHLCHRATKQISALRRASKNTLLYLINAFVAARLSLLGERICYRSSKTSALVAVSEATAAELKLYFPRMVERVRVIGNGVDAAAFARDSAARQRIRSELNLANHELLAVFVGGDWERKGLSYAVEGVASVPTWHLAVVGKGDRTRYLALTEKLHISNRIHFIGLVTDPAAWYSASDLFVLPSAYESFSLAAYEAAAAGLPLLATPVGAIPDVLDHGRNGWLIRRNVEDIVHHLRHLATRRDLLTTMGRISVEKAARFNWSEVISAYESLYGTLATAGAHGPE